MTVIYFTYAPAGSGALLRAQKSQAGGPFRTFASVIFVPLVVRKTVPPAEGRLERVAVRGLQCIEFGLLV